MNGHLCCITGECCPPEARAKSLAAEMSKELKLDPVYSTHVAEWIFKNFDLVPAGTALPLVKAISTIARAHKKE